MIDMVRDEQNEQCQCSPRHTQVSPMTTLQYTDLSLIW